MSERNAGNPAPVTDASVGEIFRSFVLIGATRFGGGAVTCLRSSLVGKHRWVDDPTFVELLSISQSIPRLNSTNVAICGRARRYLPAGGRSSCSQWAWRTACTDSARAWG